MLITSKSEIAPRVKVVDAFGKEIPFVKSFNTETKEAEIYISDKNNNIILIQKEDNTESVLYGPLIARVVLRGCKVLDRTTGEEIK